MQTNILNQKQVIGSVVVLVIIIGLALFLFKGSNVQQTSGSDAIDTAKNFYDQWLDATKEPAGADPDRQTLSQSPILSEALRDRLVQTQKNPNIIPDPVLCQTVIPEDIAIRRVYEDADEAQVLITSRDKSVTEQALFTLASINDGWYIEDIECSLGEVAPEREFTLEREGYLLKRSIPSPYDPTNWHLVFEEDGVPGHVVPLFFDSGSECTNLDGDKASCQPDQFEEATKVFVQGQMGELGASVDFLELIE